MPFLYFQPFNHTRSRRPTQVSQGEANEQTSRLEAVPGKLDRGFRHTPRISRTIEAIAEACIEISALVARGPLAGELGAEKGDNEDGDTQKALDLIANDLIIEAFTLPRYPAWFPRN